MGGPHVIFGNVSTSVGMRKSGDCDASTKRILLLIPKRQRIPKSKMGKIGQVITKTCGVGANQRNFSEL